MEIIRHALVTGATSGLGAYVSERLARDGWIVIATGRRTFENRTFPEGGRLIYLQADLSQPGATESLLSRLPALPQLVVLNAATYPDSNSSEDIAAIFQVNSIAPYQLAISLLAKIPAEQDCHFVVINSEAIYHVGATSGIYAASKAALRVLTQALAASCCGSQRSVSTLLLGPLADQRKLTEITRIAAARNIDEREVTRVFLRKSNPELVIDQLIDHDTCFQSIIHAASLGPVANGMVCKLDGGSSGPLG